MGRSLNLTVSFLLAFEAFSGFGSLPCVHFVRPVFFLCLSLLRFAGDDLPLQPFFDFEGCQSRFFCDRLIPSTVVLSPCNGEFRVNNFRGPPGQPFLNYPLPELVLLGSSPPVPKIALFG